MKIIQENAGKTQVEVAVPDMQSSCLYQVEVGYHDFKCLQSEKEYYDYQIQHNMSAGDIFLIIFVFVMVFIAGFAIGRVTAD